MGAEIGATTSLFPFNDRMYDYLAATKRKDIGDFARVYAKELREDEGAEVRNISLYSIFRAPIFAGRGHISCSWGGSHLLTEIRC
jgi:hypothetical protein